MSTVQVLVPPFLGLCEILEAPRPDTNVETRTRRTSVDMARLRAPLLGFP